MTRVCHPFYVTYEEEDKIIKAIEESDRRYQHLKDMVKIALNTSMRQGEILGMKKELDRAQGRAYYRSQDRSKTQSKGRVPINSEIRPIIQWLLRANRDSEYLVVNPKTGARFTAIQNSWSRILKKAGLWGKPGVDKLRFHDLRHTASTTLARRGKDMKFLAQYFGHSDVRTSARYVHHSDEDLKAGAEALVHRVPSNFTTPKIEAVKTQSAHSSVG
jgi:integrase